MMKGIQRKPLNRLEFLQFHSVFSTPLKRDLKISNQKYPADFFLQSNQTPQRLIKRPEAFTQEDKRITLGKLSTHKRDMSTAVETRKKDEDEDLIQGVLSTARQMGRIIRKHSIEIKKSKVTRQIDFELPPLIMKKGNTTPF